MKKAEPSWRSKFLEPVSLFTLLLFFATVFLGVATIWFIHATDKGGEESIRTATENTKKLIEATTAETERNLTTATENTVKTIQATAAETERSIRAATEVRLLPIVVLGTHDDFTEKPAVHTIVIRNLGFGPALNTVTGAFGTVTLGKATVQFNHRSAIGPDEIQDIDYMRKIDGEPEYTRITTSLGTPPLKRATRVADVEGDVKAAQQAGVKGGIAVCISYANAERETYETWHHLYETSGSELAIDFVCQSKTKTPCSFDRVNHVQASLNPGAESAGRAFGNVCRAK